MMWPYTQSDHDRAVELGGIGCVVTVVLIVVVALVLAVVA